MCTCTYFSRYKVLPSDPWSQPVEDSIPLGCLTVRFQSDLCSGRLHCSH